MGLILKVLKKALAQKINWEHFLHCRKSEKNGKSFLSLNFCCLQYNPKVQGCGASLALEQSKGATKGLRVGPGPLFSNFYPSCF